VMVAPTDGELHDRRINDDAGALPERTEKLANGGEDDEYSSSSAP